MDRLVQKMERKFGRYAIPNLTKYIIGLYIVGMILQLAPANVNFSGFLTLDPYMILHGQVWRLITWVLIPPVNFNFLVIITLLFYYYVGNTMERTLGTFRYNLFIFTGMLLMIVASFVTLFVYKTVFNLTPEGLSVLMNVNSISFSTYYIQMMVFLSFAICYPDMTVLFMLFIPLKVKWLGIFYGAVLAFNAFNAVRGSNYFLFFAILSQALNLLLFYLSLGKMSHLRPSEVKRRAEFKRNVQIRPKGITRHKCAICGRSEEDDPNLEFRFCSKCNGNYEYCQDHLFTHEHKK